MSPQRVGALLSGTVLMAVAVGVGAPGASAIQPTAAPSASATAFAVIGTITLPGSGNADHPYVSADDTLYVPTNGGNYVAVINPSRTSGAPDDNLAVAGVNDVVMSNDDTLFAARYLNQQVQVFGPGAHTPAYTIGVTNYPEALAINSDDTLLISQLNNSTGGSISFVSRNSQTVSSSVAAVFGSPYSPGGVVVDSVGGFYVGSNTTSAKYIPRTAVAPSLTVTGLNQPTQIGITPDDTLLTTGQNVVFVVPRNATTPSATISLGTQPSDITVMSTGVGYTANYSAGTVTRVDPVAQTATPVLTGIATPAGIADSSTGLLYIATGSGMKVITAKEVGAGLATPTATPGSTVAVNVTGLPSGVQMDDATVKSVWWGDDTLPFTRSGNSVSVIAPAGSGSVPIVLGLHGGNAVTAGTFTYYVPPPPPPDPPVAPTAVVASAGDASASVSWTAPASSGSFPVTSYQVESVPSAGACLTSTLTCEVTSLRNGTSYAFRVRALSGAGWSPWSELSAPVTPAAPRRPSIVITGGRGEVRGMPGIVVAGTVKDAGMGALVTPWSARAGGDFRPGTSTLVSIDGTFTWSRRASAKATWIVYVTMGDLRSNVVTIRPER